jgi:Protein of unknown function (DUF3309)
MHLVPDFLGKRERGLFGTAKKWNLYGLPFVFRRKAGQQRSLPGGGDKAMSIGTIILIILIIALLGGFSGVGGGPFYGTGYYGGGGLGLIVVILLILLLLGRL